jgi:CubicO group peptidase (beta-lactamase class C family)
MTTATLSTPRLERLHQVLSGYIHRGDMPGLVALVSRRGDGHIETLGTMSVGHPAPMKRDTISRLASLTKPITAVAAMMLLEACQLRRDDSLVTWWPELANRRVLRSLAAEPDDTVPATRAITVRDLLTSCLGFGRVLAMPGTYPIQKLSRELQIGGDGPPRPAQVPPADEGLRRLGALPWMAQPGERWRYHVSSECVAW